MAVTKYLDKTGLTYLWGKIKAWCNATFALISHTHSAATTSANGFLSSTDKTKLNSLSQYPRFTYTAFNFIPSNSGTNYINQNSNESILTHLSTTQESVLRFKTYKGLSLTFEQPNIQSDAQYNDFHFVVDGARLAGDGLIGSAGILSVPEYEGATASANATSGLVPPALKAERSYFLKGDGTWGDLSSKAEDSNVVHKTGNEIITGKKAFQQTSFIIQNPYVELGTFETSYENYHNNLEIFFADKNYDPSSGNVPEAGTTRLGEIQWQRRSNSGGDSFELTLREASDPNGPFVLGSIGIIYKPVSGAWYGYCPSTPLPSVDNSANAIVTRNFIPNDTRIVHTTGNETIAGIKTFSSTVKISKSNSTVGNPALLLEGSGQNHIISAVDTSVKKGTVPSANKYWGINFYGEDYDNVNKRIGLVETSLLGNSNICRTSIVAYDCTTNTNQNVCCIRAIVDGSGNAYTEAPTPTSTTDDSTKIATTAWVRDATGDFACNAATATAFASSKAVTLTGAVTGTVSSTGGWSVSTVWRSCIVGCTDNSTSNPWYKVASKKLTGGSSSYNITFYIENANTANKSFGILRVAVGTNSNKTINAGVTKFAWLVNNGFVEEDFVLVCPTTAEPTVELWTKIAGGYLRRRFVAISEGSNVSTEILWTLFNTVSAGQEASIPTEGTQVVSAASELAGNIETATKATQDSNGNTIASTYLPLSGGTMTGAITRNGNLAQSGSTSGSISIFNGTGASGGGGIWLYGKDNTNAGTVRLQAYNGSYYKLDVNSDGTSVTNTNFVIAKNAAVMHFQMTNLDTTVTSTTSKIHSVISFVDKNALESKYRTAVINSGMTSSDENFIRIAAYNPTANSTSLDGINIYYPRSGSPYVTSITPSAGDNSTKIATTAYVQGEISGFAADSDVVHKANAETISGTKTFSSSIVANVQAIIKCSTTGSITSFYGGTESANGARLELYGGTRSTNPGSFSITATIDSSINTQLLGKPDGTLTWGGSDITGDVHKATTETITGAKSFSSSVNVLHSVARGTNPSSTSYKQFNFLDSSATNGTTTRAACVENYIGTNGDVSLFLRAYKWTASTNTQTNLEIKYPISGDPSLLWNGSDIIKHATACSNCNAALAAGLYKTTSSTTNAPDAFGGILTVERADDGSFVWQTIKSYSTDYYRPIWTRRIALNTNGAYSSATAWVISSYLPINASRSLFNNSISSKLVLCPPDGTILRGQSGSNYEFMRLYHTRDWSRDSTGESYGYIGRYSASNDPTGTSANQAQFIIGESCGGISSYNFSFGCYYQCASDVVYTDTTTERVYGVYLKAGDTYNNKTVESVTYFRNTNNKPWFRYEYDNVANLGGSSNRFAAVYAGTGTIQTSDERLKDNISNIPDKILDTWDSIKWVQFKFKESIQEKGDNARIHVGAIAQSIDNNFKDNNIDISSYGFFCYDKWEEEWDEDENGVKQKIKDSGDRYSLRYEEALCIEAAYQRRKNKILENRISELEKQVSDMIILLQNLTKGNG